MGKVPSNPAPPPSLIKEPTVLTPRSPKMVTDATKIMAIKAAGIFLVNFGIKYIINMVRTTKPSII